MEGPGKKRKSVVLSEEILNNLKVKKTTPVVTGASLFNDDLKKGGRPKGSSNFKTTAEKQERRKELNRVNAARSRLRKRFNVEEWMIKLYCLQEENKRLKKQLQRKHANTSNARPRQGDGQTEQGEIHEVFSLLENQDEADCAMLILASNAPNYQVRFATPTFYSLMGLSAEEVIGHDIGFLDTQQQGTQSLVMEALCVSVETGKPSSVKTVNVRKDGEKMGLHVHVEPVFGLKEGEESGASLTSIVVIVKSTKEDEEPVDGTKGEENVDGSQPEDHPIYEMGNEITVKQSP